AQVAVLAGSVRPVDAGPARLAGIMVAAGAIALLWWTVGSHRARLALWHQDDDAPVEIVTWGPYRLVRHPFYTSFLSALAAGALVAPHAVTAAPALFGLVALTLTARREERRLAASHLGAQYRAYLGRTGRFLPRVPR
ncbi:MAG: methyltransferase family protein, partial [Acidimicrobiales bacterium]